MLRRTDLRWLAGPQLGAGCQNWNRIGLERLNLFQSRRDYRR